MLEVLNQPYFDEVMAWAKERGLAEQLQGKLDYLATYSGQPGIVCKLWSDLAPHSFTFAIYRNGTYWFNGGLIYQGPADGSFPSLTVSLAEGIGWFVHT